MRFVILLTLGLALAGYAEVQSVAGPFDLKNQPLGRFIEDYAQKTGERIVVGEDLLKKIAGRNLSLTVNKPLSAEQYKNLFYSVLRNFNLTLFEQEGFASLMEERDIRYTPTSIVSAKDLDSNKEKYVMAAIRTEYPLASEISRNLRPFLSRYSRVISLSNAKLLLIQDTEKNVSSLRQLVAAMDTKQAYEAYLERRKKQALEKNLVDEEALLKRVEELTRENIALKKVIESGQQKEGRK